MFGIGKKPYFLGIDFGTSAIKAVELTIKNDLPVLLNYGSIDMSVLENPGKMFRVPSPEKTVQDHLSALFSALHPVSKGVSIALPGFSGLITLIEMPLMKSEELEKAIQFEAHKYIPSPLEEVAFSWEVVSGNAVESGGDDRKTMEVLLVAALRKEVAKYERYVAKTNLPVDLLELEIFSLVRAVAKEKPGTLLIADIGSRATNLVLVQNGDIRLNRSLNAGGHEVTATLAESYNVSWERAEELKRGTKDFLNHAESSLSFSSLDLIVTEMNRIFEMHTTRDPKNPVQEILLSGGTSQMEGLVSYLSNRFHVPVSVSNPWRSLQYDGALQSSLERLGPTFTIAIGLALGGLEQYRKR